MAKLPGRIYKRGSSWVVDIIEHSGYRFRKAVGSNRAQAQRILANKQAELRAAREDTLDDGIGTVEGPTVAAVWRYYISRMKAECKPATVTTVTSVQKRWAVLDNRRVYALTQDDISAVVDAMPTAITTKNTAIKIFRAALRRMVRDMKMDRYSFTLKELDHVLPMPQIVTRGEFKALVSATRDYRAITLMMLARFAGLRQSEAVFLTLGNLDFEAGVINITAKEDFGFSPKNYEERPVPMFDMLANVIKDHISLMRDWTPWEMETGSPLWLFQGQKQGHPLTRVTVSRLVKAAYDGAGIKGNRPGLHRLRRTWATKLLKAHDLGTLMRLGGWHSLKTVERYIGSDTDAAREAIDSQEF